jgi:hypothetical protein
MSDETPLGVQLGRLAAADPGRPVLTCGPQSRSRAEMEARTNRLARAYANLGVTHGPFVTIGLPNGIEFFEATVAAWKLGATPQPISSRLPAAERSAIIELASSSLVVGVDPSEAPGRGAVPAGFEPDPSQSADPLPPVIAAAFKAPTSGGSTGRPKLIVATQSAAWEAVAGFAALLRIPENGVHLVSGPLYHNGPFTTAVLALLALAFLGGGVAGADDWPGSSVFAVFSENGRHFVRFIPGESVGDTVGFAGAPKGRYATALLYALQPDRAYRLQHEITLTNPMLPLGALVADDGALHHVRQLAQRGLRQGRGHLCTDRPVSSQLGADRPLSEGQGRGDPALGVLALLAVPASPLRRSEGSEGGLRAGSPRRLLRVHARDRRGRALAGQP